ncbi:MAG: hypothetical protein Q8O55_01525 [Dehalococcoidales bacterium]|nr:hypothetical protein [Dehalococcoidales bacterium]
MKFLWYIPRSSRFEWQHYKTTMGWFQMMRFGIFGVNLYKGE